MPNHNHIDDIKVSTADLKAVEGFYADVFG
jgi:catechol-2,3-dioxygenase